MIQTSKHTYRTIANKCSIFELKIEQRTTDAAFTSLFSLFLFLVSVVAAVLPCTCRMCNGWLLMLYLFGAAQEFPHSDSLFRNFSELGVCVF